MPFDLLATILPPGPGLPVPWWVFWWGFVAIAFTLFQWWWAYRAARHDRDLHEEARHALRQLQNEDDDTPPSGGTEG